MRELFGQADLERGELNNVPLSTMYGLVNRGFISDNWRKVKGIREILSQSGHFPHFSGVKLTEAGVRAARALKQSPK